MKQIELLAPAGSIEGLKAAIAFGADAVYMGGHKYNARVNAKNFDIYEIKDAIKLVRLRGKKVYITLNTVLFENEIKDVIDYVNELEEMGANAVILQDLGVAKLISEECTIPMHASTQMGVHSLSGCDFIEKMGFERAILARETPLSEIRHIRENSDIEIEAFVHGALCACFSGQCYFSYLKGGRSGNRGDCAQPCRLSRKEYGHPLSTKDLMSLELIPELISAGISSFKIEGRMKRPAYAGIVTNIYRQAIDLALENKNITVEKFREELIKIYNRGGFTKGYYLDKKDIFGTSRPNHMGEEVGVVTGVKRTRLEIKTTKEIQVYDGLSFGQEGMEISDLYENGVRVQKGIGKLSFSCVLKDVKVGDIVYRTTDKAQLDLVEKQINEDKVTIPIVAECCVDDYVTVKLSAIDKSVKVTSDNPTQTAKTRGVTKEDIIKSMSKLGDTMFELDEIKVEVKEGIFVAVSELNAIRRKAVEALENAIIAGDKREKIQYSSIPLRDDNKYKRIVIGIDKKERPDDCDLFLVYPDYIGKRYNSVDGIVLPSVSLEADLKLVENSVQPEDIVVCNNVGQIERLKGKCRIWAGMGMNCTNTYSAELLYSMGCEQVIGTVEADVKGTLKIKGGRIPAMTFVACPKKASVGCDKCRKENIIDGAGRDFTCVTMKETYSFLLSEYKSNFGQVEFI